MKPMKASEARKLTNENLRGPVIKPALAFIYKKIVRAAKRGNSSLPDPFGCNPRLSPDVQKAVCAQLREDGFKVEQRPNPDSGLWSRAYQCFVASDYERVSW